MDELRAISVFVEAAQSKSFHQAAVHAGLTPQAVSRTIRELERHLNVRLFHRTTRKNSLTEEGLQFFETVKPGLDTMRSAVSRARSSAEEIEGPIRISATRPIGRKLLLPLIARFRERHPRVEFELALDEGFTDIVSEKIDIGFRSGNPPEGQLIARRLFAIRMFVGASPQYVARHGAPATLDELSLHPCTGYRMSQTGRLMPWEFLVDGEVVFRDMPAAFCTNDPEAELDAVMAGLGIGLLDSINAGAQVQAGRLLVLLPQHASERQGLYIYYAQRSNMPKRVRAFIDFAIDELLDSPAHRMPASVSARRAGG